MSRVAEALLRRHRDVTLAALAALAMLAWTWIASGAGTGMAARVEFTLFPHRSQSMGMPMGWDAHRVALNLAMWWVMMVAMMTPAAAPVILLYARAARANAAIRPHAGAFLGGYLLAWLGFSAVAVALQMALVAGGLMSPMAMALSSRWPAGGALIAAGLYQFSPAKDECLAHCRNPADFIARHFRPGPSGALRMGLIHGSYCVGCCWLLMALLFVVGVMNLAWIALLTILVGTEKLSPGGVLVARTGGVLFLAWGATILALG